MFRTFLTSTLVAVLIAMIPAQDSAPQATTQPTQREIELERQVEALKAHPKIEKVASVTSQDHIEGSEEGFIVGPLIDIDDLDSTSEAQRKARVIQDRFANRMLVAPDGSALAIVILPASIDDSLARMALPQRADRIEILRGARLPVG